MADNNVNMQNPDGVQVDPAASTTQPEEKKTRKKAAPEEERVEVYIPRGQSNDDPNFFVSVNGTNYLLPKGKKSMVPKCVAEEIRRAFEAQEMLEQLVRQMAQEQGITEQLKAEDQMAWVGAMNNIRSAAEEVVIREVVFG